MELYEGSFYLFFAVFIGGHIFFSGRQSDPKIPNAILSLGIFWGFILTALAAQNNKGYILIDCVSFILFLSYDKWDSYF